MWIFILRPLHILPIIHDFFQLLRLLTTLHRSKPDRTPTKHRDYIRVYTGSSFIHMRKLGFTLGPLRIYFVGVHFKHRSVKKAVLPYSLSACYSYPCNVRFRGLILVGDYPLCPLRVTLGLLWFNSWPALVNPE